MEPVASDAQSFIVKVWLEEPAADGAPARWRGHITHVPSGRRGYMQNLVGITDFIAPYLAAMGAQLDLSQRVRRWWRQPKV